MSAGPLLVLDGLLADPEHEPVSLAIHAGECVALLTAEPSRAAPLVDRVAGHTRSGNGRIILAGLDISDLPPVQRRIGLVSARDPLFGPMTVLRNVAFPLAVRRLRQRECRHRARSALALLGVDQLSARRPAALDVTEALRVALARVLVSDPAVIVLDDALATLHSASRPTMQGLLRRLARARGFALLAITGDREEALAIGDRIGILDGGTLRQLGTASALLDRPADEQVATGFGQANTMTGTVEWVEDDVARVRLAAGASMAAMSTGALREGMLCVVCVRPERVAVAFGSGRQDALGADALVGTLTDMANLGDHVRLRFRLGGGGEVLVRRPASQPLAGLRIDQPALLAWQPAHAVAFPLAE